jgi:hypothetical protein
MDGTGRDDEVGLDLVCQSYWWQQARIRVTVAKQAEMAAVRTYAGGVACYSSGG